MDAPTTGVSVEEARELIQGILRDFPGHQAGTRPVHSYGAVATGRFKPNDVAARYTSAVPLMATGGVDVTVRFSSGTGNHGDSDSGRDVRGMAVRFHAPGSAAPGGPERNQRIEAGAHLLPDKDRPLDLDLVCMTLPVFFVRTVAAFKEFTRAVEPPQPPVTRSIQRLLLDAANLRTSLKDPAPGDPGAAAFSARRPEVCPALAAAFNAGTPESFATISYHAVHAFRLTNDARAARFVRFHWEPVAGVRTTGSTAERYLQRELRARGALNPIRFVLRAQVADQGDDTSDTSRPWPQTRRRLVLGQLTLDTFPAGDDGETLEFNPHRLPVGIDPDLRDEIFHVRGRVYAVSATDRAKARVGR